MKYEIKGDTLPVVICHLEAGERMITERGSMAWMSPNMKMETSTNGGFGKAFGRMFSGEAMFQNIYTAQGGNGLIAFASSFPGSIKAFEIGPGQEYIFQKKAFLAGEPGVNISVHFHKKVASGLFGGEGFILQKVSGNGIHQKPPVEVMDEKLMFRLIRASFNQRRKTLANGLKNSGELNLSKEVITAAIEKLGKGSSVRGEALDLEEFARLTNIIKEEMEHEV